MFHLIHTHLIGIDNSICTYKFSLVYLERVKRYTIEKIINVMVSLRTAHLFQKVILFANQNWAYVNFEIAALL